MNAYTTALAALLGILTGSTLYAVLTGLVCGWPPWAGEGLCLTSQAELKRKWLIGIALTGFMGLGFTGIWTIILEALLT